DSTRDCARRRAGAELGGPPAVPGQDGPERPVGLAERLELARAGRRDVPREAVAVAYPEVGDRPDVEPAQLEDEEHLRRPWPDAAHARQPGDDLVVGLPGERTRRQDDRAVERLAREVAQRADLGARQADGPQRLVGQG